MEDTLAAILLAHCPKGPALDILIEDAKTVPALKVAPSAELVRKLRRSKVSATKFAGLVRATDSVDVLTEIVAEDSRVTIRRAAAANPHLGPEQFLVLAQEAIAGDQDMRNNLWNNSGLERRLELFVRAQTAPPLVPTWPSELLLSAIERGDEGLDLLAAALDCTTLNQLGRHAGVLCEEVRRSPVTVSALVRHFQGVYSEPSTRQPEYVRYRTASVFIRPDDPASWRAVLEEIRHPDVALAIAAVADSTRHIPTDELLGYVSNDGLFEFAQLFRRHGGAYNETLVQRFCAGKDVRRVRAELSLASYTHDGYQALEASEHADLMLDRMRDAELDTLVWYLGIHPEYAEVHSMPGHVIHSLFETDLDPDILWKVVSTYYRRMTGYQQAQCDLNEVILRNGPGSMLTWVPVGEAGMELILARPDRSEVLAEGANALLASRIRWNDDVRRELYLSADAANILYGENAIDENDLAWYLERCSEKQRTELQSWVQSAAQKSSQSGPWARPAVHLVPLNWGNVSAGEFLDEMFTTAQADLGDDRPLWELFLGLLPSWHGTIDELLVTVREI